MDRRKGDSLAEGAAAMTELFPGFLLALSPDLVYFHKDEITKVWDCVSECCHQDLLLKKRVGLMGLGTIHIMKRPIWHGEGEGFMADSLEFDLNKPSMVQKKRVPGKSPVPGLSKADELVCAEVALRLHKPKATIVMCIKATLKICEWALSSGQNFDFVFKDIGILVCRGNHVVMRFFEDLVRRVAQSQYLAEGLLQSPDLKPLFIAYTEKDISQIPPGGVLVLPHFVKADGKSQPHPISAFLQGSGTRSKTNTKCQKSPENTPSQHILLRPRLSPSRICDVKVMGREKKKADGGVQRGSLLPPIENSVKKGTATKGMEAPQAGLAAPTRQGKHVQLPPLEGQRSLGKAAAFCPGGFEKLRKERVAAVAGVAAALSPERKEKTLSHFGGRPQPRTPRAKQVLLNLQPYKVAREQCMKALQMNRLRKWSDDNSLTPGSTLSLVKALQIHEETTAELEHENSDMAP
ncbi:coiled-coil domain-containing protein 81-like [Oenanthe melanoleuca]|uniref:coiled-coil domain-containing protein 81-like n=1 Tax=Oenanthe melanoleuca TaxID=2939378 RepID=UPI0024C120FE|nr:coiled-coil domain-containing protein 81-like [Oenanthe melanoleuca]